MKTRPVGELLPEISNPHAILTLVLSNAAHFSVADLANFSCPCMLIRKAGKPVSKFEFPSGSVLLQYVDDLLICSPSGSQSHFFQTAISSKYIEWTQMCHHLELIWSTFWLLYSTFDWGFECVTFLQWITSSLEFSLRLTWKKKGHETVDRTNSWKRIQFIQSTVSPWNSSLSSQL